MKVAVAALFAALSLTLSAAALAEDCAKSSRPELCKAYEEAKAACKDKKTREEERACIKEKLKTEAEAPKK